MVVINSTKIIILLIAIAFFAGFAQSANAGNCPDPAPYCDKGNEVCIFNTNTNTCTCACCDHEGKNCNQNYP
ncbi:hypothetical protein Glove_384g48 [Diversispora epigaea]|uniref:EGF-like domain-containing protein n=1 Tax=Diversispora epigaea TaxID=1348612 RepID=A0A397HBG5_9GLOM|nr:hypothetical protein Glove_384g48 [Diversispora epigaea]